MFIDFVSLQNEKKKTKVQVHNSVIGHEGWREPTGLSEYLHHPIHEERRVCHSSNLRTEPLHLRVQGFLHLSPLIRFDLPLSPGKNADDRMNDFKTLYTSAESHFPDFDSLFFCIVIIFCKTTISEKWSRCLGCLIVKVKYVLTICPHFPHAAVPNPVRGK